MSRALIVGASGMIGNIVLKQCLEDSRIEQVVSMTRRTLGFEHNKLQEHIHENFIDFTGKEHLFEKVDYAFFCIGVYTGQVPDDQFKMITVDMAVAFADSLKNHSPSATLCFLSGQGADLTEKSRMSFARYKGMAENYLLNKDFKSLFIFRPAYIYPVETRKEPNVTYSILRFLYPILNKIYSKGAIRSDALGKAMFTAALTGAPKTILENEDIKAILTL